MISQRTFLLLIMVVSVSLFSCVSVSDENGTAKSIAYYDQISDIRSRTTGEPVHTVIARFALGYNPQDRTVLNAIRENRAEIASLLTSYFKEKTAEQLTLQNKKQIKQELIHRYFVA
jgi:flagellar basal body-associated protein FliL